jgi:ubiquinone/menaquinone biosynthesis C-methylase UbiE
MLIAAAALQPGDRVLDVACGTGIVARLVAEQIEAEGSVVGLDLNAGMLAVARSLSQAAGFAVEWQEGNALALPFSDATFDVVLCQQGLQFFPDRPLALKEMHRVLVPEERLALNIWCSIEHSPGYPVLVEALEQHIGSAAATVMRAPFSLPEAWEVRALLTEANFHDIDIRVREGIVHFASPEEFVRGTVASTPLASLVAQADDDARWALLHEVMTRLQPYVDSSGLAFPIQSHLVTAHT